MVFLKVGSAVQPHSAHRYEVHIVGHDLREHMATCRFQASQKACGMLRIAGSPDFVWARGETVEAAAKLSARTAVTRSNRTSPSSNCLQVDRRIERKSA